MWAHARKSTALPSPPCRPVDPYFVRRTGLRWHHDYVCDTHADLQELMCVWDKAVVDCGYMSPI